mmetsp:Transcript_3477/g.14355  ORF Transcript_3477/g.14355 Transcript_3477/m.14355 type:complete len:416 (+) Transcript_3477:730-1977(+)
MAHRDDGPRLARGRCLVGPAHSAGGASPRRPRRERTVLASMPGRRRWPERPGARAALARIARASRGAGSALARAAAATGVSGSAGHRRAAWANADPRAGGRRAGLEHQRAGWGPRGGRTHKLCHMLSDVGGVVARPAAKQGGRVVGQSDASTGRGVQPRLCGAQKQRADRRRGRKERASGLALQRRERGCKARDGCSSRVGSRGSRGRAQQANGGQLEPRRRRQQQQRRGPDGSLASEHRSVRVSAADVQEAGKQRPRVGRGARRSCVKRRGRGDHGRVASVLWGHPRTRGTWRFMRSEARRAGRLASLEKRRVQPRCPSTACGVAGGDGKGWLRDWPARKRCAFGMHGSLLGKVSDPHERVERSVLFRNGLALAATGGSFALWAWPTAAPPLPCAPLPGSLRVGPGWRGRRVGG